MVTLTFMPAPPAELKYVEAGVSPSVDWLSLLANQTLSDDPIFVAPPPYNSSALNIGVSSLSIGSTKIYVYIHNGTDAIKASTCNYTWWEIYNSTREWVFNENVSMVVQATYITDGEYMIKITVKSKVSDVPVLIVASQFTRFLAQQYKVYGLAVSETTGEPISDAYVSGHYYDDYGVIQFHSPAHRDPGQSWSYVKLTTNLVGRYYFLMGASIPPSNYTVKDSYTSGEPLDTIVSLFNSSALDNNAGRTWPSGYWALGLQYNLIVNDNFTFYLMLYSKTFMGDNNHDRPVELASYVNSTLSNMNETSFVNLIEKNKQEWKKWFNRIPNPPPSVEPQYYVYWAKAWFNLLAVIQKSNYPAFNRYYFAAARHVYSGKIYDKDSAYIMTAELLFNRTMAAEGMMSWILAQTTDWNDVLPYSLSSYVGGYYSESPPCEDFCPGFPIYTSKNGVLNSPIFFYTFWYVYLSTQDISNLSEIYERLKQLYNWYKANRYNSTTGLFYHIWYGHEFEGPYGEDKWGGRVGNYSSPLLNSLMYILCKRMAQIALRLGKPSEASYWQSEADNLAIAIEQLWSEADGQYLVMDETGNKSLSYTNSPGESLAVLSTGLVSKERAERILELLLPKLESSWTGWDGWGLPIACIYFANGIAKYNKTLALELIEHDVDIFEGHGHAYGELTKYGWHAAGYVIGKMIQSYGFHQIWLNRDGTFSFVWGVEDAYFADQRLYVILDAPSGTITESVIYSPFGIPRAVYIYNQLYLPLSSKADFDRANFNCWYFDQANNLIYIKAVAGSDIPITVSWQTTPPAPAPSPMQVTPTPPAPTPAPQLPFKLTPQNIAIILIAVAIIILFFPIPERRRWWS